MVAGTVVVVETVVPAAAGVGAVEACTSIILDPSLIVAVVAGAGAVCGGAATGAGDAASKELESGAGAGELSCA